MLQNDVRTVASLEPEDLTKDSVWKKLSLFASCHNVTALNDKFCLDVICPSEETPECLTAIKTPER